MRKPRLLIVSAVIMIFGVMCLMAYNVYVSYSLTELQLKNIEALVNDEESGEWVKKTCYTVFSNTHGKDFYASCSGTPSVPGGILECGAVSSEQPLWGITLEYDCLQRVNE